MPLINKVRGTSTKTPQLPEQVENFRVSAGILSATLTWEPPKLDQNNSFIGVRIVRKVGTKPKNPNDGTVVYEGTEFTYTDTDLTKGLTYYYRAFAYNSEGQYQPSERCVSTVPRSERYLSMLEEGSIVGIEEYVLNTGVETTENATVDITTGTSAISTTSIIYGTSYTFNDDGTISLADASTTEVSYAAYYNASYTLKNKYVKYDGSIYLVSSVSNGQKSSDKTYYIRITGTKYTPYSEISDEVSIVPFYVAKHNYESDLNGNGRTLLVRKDCLDSNTDWYSSDIETTELPYITYEGSNLKSFIENTYSTFLPERVINYIGTTNILESDAVVTTTVSLAPVTKSRSLFVLSATELGYTYQRPSSGSVPTDFSGIGSAIPIASSIRQVSDSSGTYIDYWTRDVNVSNNWTYYQAYFVDSSQDAIETTQYTTTKYVRPCFTMSGDELVVSNEPNEDGYYTIVGDTSTVPTTATLGTIAEGSMLAIEENGTPVPFYVAKHNYEPDLNGEGRTLLVRKDVLSETRVWEESSSNYFVMYPDSSISSWLNSDYISLLSTSIREILSETMFEYVSSLDESILRDSEYIFLLSSDEYGIQYNAEGEALPICNDLIIAQYEGEAVTHWTRSRTAGSSLVTGTAAAIKADGTCYNYQFTSSHYVRPAFTLPNTITLSPEPNSDGYYELVQPALISFNIEGESFQAEEGMTWTEWVNSEYCVATGDIVEFLLPADSDTVMFTGDVVAIVKYDGTPVSRSDVIIANAEYYGYE